MNLQEFCKKLANGRLSNTFLVEESAGTNIIKIVHKPKVIDAINEGLSRLYTRFVLYEKDVVIALVSHITDYRLNSLYSETLYPQDGVDVPYIMDLPGKVFINDVIKILYVLDHYGNEYPLNDSKNPNSLYSSKFDTLHVPKPKTGDLINVIYQAKHIELTIEGPLEELILHSSLIGALEAYVTHLLFSDVNTDDAKIRSDKQLTRYEQICSEVILTDIVSSTVISTKTKFNERGWI